MSEFPPTVHQNFFSSLKILNHAANTPITNILINLDLLTQDPNLDHLSSNGHYYLQKALLSCKYLKKLMQQSSTKNLVSNHPFKIKNAITEVTQVCKKPTTNVQLIKYLQLSGNEQLIGNKLYFQETLICLLNNAFAAYKNISQPNQLVVLTASIENNRLEMKVVDSARGFLQLNDSSSLKNKLSITDIPITGTGLEFAQKAIVNHFKGKILISTKLYKGTTVHCSLPLSTAK